MIEMITMVTCMIMSVIVGETLRFVDEEKALGVQEEVDTAVSARDVPFGNVFLIRCGEPGAKPILQS
jgi:hypothetical protein